MLLIADYGSVIILNLIILITQKYNKNMSKWNFLFGFIKKATNAANAGDIP